MLSEHFAMTADALRNRYRVERLLQTGVAACVYLAEDRTSGRRVAVKVLRDEMAATVDADRFLAEINVVRQLRHPNIVPMYDSGDIDGIPYYVMPFVEGESLRARLTRLGRIPLGETLRIAEDVARALHFAHRHQVVHRDIKPENVMLDGDRALVLDFGIALAMDRVEAPRRTLPGLTLGTFHYMSPEQVEGGAEIDGRSDIYSLACTVYEMLSGRPPFLGTPNAVMRQQLSARPRPLASLCAGMPPRLDAALLCALDKSPDKRYSTAGEFIASLVSGSHRVRVIGRRVAVIPFVHACAQPVLDTRSDTVGEEVAVALRDFEGIVIAPNVSSGSDPATGHMIDIARRAGADVVLLGNVRRADDDAGVLITAMLFDGRTGRRIWSGAAAGKQPDTLAPTIGPAREIARAVAGALGAKRLTDRAACSAATTPSFTAPAASRTGTDERPVVR
ncbi:MAG TPA: serine/threonine-protein kinase [Gemmatimonadaceae bacterium]|nr:serine/threonine-protein kinase [Gemmatimonadaceae bacterium]